MFKKSLMTLVLFLGVSVTASVAAQDMTDAKITVQRASGDVYMLQGPGGNIGVLSTEKGLLLVSSLFLLYLL